MKRILAILITLFLLSCEEEKYVITEIGDISMSDRINGPFSINVSFKTMLLANKWNIIPTAQAYKSMPYYVNAIDLNTIHVSIDKVHKKNGLTIASREEIKDYKILSEYANNNLLREPYFSIIFSDSLLNSLEFQKGETKFFVTGKNTDNVVFKFEKEVFLDL